MKGLDGSEGRGVNGPNKVGCSSCWPKGRLEGLQVSVWLGKGSWGGSIGGIMLLSRGASSSLTVGSVNEAAAGRDHEEVNHKLWNKFCCISGRVGLGGGGGGGKSGTQNNGDSL